MVIDWNSVGVRMNEAGKIRWPFGTRDQLPWSRVTPDHELWLVWAGQGTIRISTGVIPLTPGTVLWLRPGTSYPAEQDPDNPVGTYWVHFDLLNREGGVRSYSQPAPSEQLHVRDAPLVHALFRRIVELVPMPGLADGSADRTLIANRMLAALLAELDSTQTGIAQVNTGTKEYYRRTLVPIAEEIERKPWVMHTVADLASRAGYSEDHFSKLFKTEIGRRPMAFMMRARIKYAARLLLGTTLRVSDIARKTGYADSVTFNKQFKKVMNCTPTDYRRLGDAVANQSEDDDEEDVSSTQD